MKKLTKFSVAILALAGLSSAALAATPGAYVGAGLGYGQLEGATVGSPVPGVTSSLSKGFVAGRVFGGYNLSQNFGVEGGYSYLGREKYTFKNKQVSDTSVSVTNQLQDLDLVGKAYLPLSNSGFNLYALGGVAYVHSNVSGNASGKGYDVNFGSDSSNAVRPKYGVGVSYDVPNSQLTTSLELSRVQGQGSSSDFPNADSALLTISYNFD
jgi:OmpA-OmpF porin, OOP family